MRSIHVIELKKDYASHIKNELALENDPDKRDRLARCFPIQKPYSIGSTGGFAASGVQRLCLSESLHTYMRLCL